MKKSIFISSVFFAAALLFFGCQSVPENIPDDLDARQLIQLGQDNYDLHHYAAAKKYFNTVLDRFGDDPKHYIEAKYELGHLFLKQKNYRSAYNNFTEILEIYENVPAGLPGSYKILCGIELAKIPEEKMTEFKARANEEKQAALRAQEAEKAELLRLQEEQDKKEREAAMQKAAIEEGQNAQGQTPAEQESAPQEAEPEKSEPQSADEPAKTQADSQAKESAEEKTPEANSNE